MPSNILHMYVLAAHYICIGFYSKRGRDISKSQFRDTIEIKAGAKYNFG